ncbi:MAG: hypothetical protein HY646_19145 [Acidobacteria bacterium]|nr:hypothetical protein [Acidobacteriota bacterium]
MFIRVSLLFLGAVTLLAQHPTPDPQRKTVPAVDYGPLPKSPSIDNYYLDGDPAGFIPDEFMSNPGGEVDPTKLKGYHLPPILRWAKVKGKRIINAGEEIKLEAQAESPVKIQPWFLLYQGPHGRRTTFRATFTPRADNPWLHDGVVRTTKWSEPGIYIVYDGELNSELGHSKAYFPGLHPEIKGLEFEILPNPDADIEAPKLVNIFIGEGDTPENGKTFDVKDTIPVRATVTDDRSGPKDLTLRLSGPDNKYIEVKLQPLYSRQGEYIGFFKINPWSVGGEYLARTLTIVDNAGNRREIFAPTNKLLQAVKFSINQDAKNVDKTIPRLISVSFDKATAKMTDEIKITAIAFDGMSGVGDVYVDVAASPSFIDKKRIKLSPKPKPPIIKPGFDVDDNVYEGTFKTNQLDEPGDWIVTRVFVRDRANNYLDVRATEHSDLASVKVVYADGSAPPASSSAPATAAPAGEASKKIPRVNMTPPHPPRGPCLNCHDPKS